MRFRYTVACAAVAIATLGLVTPASAAQRQTPARTGPDPNAPHHGVVAGARTFVPDARSKEAVRRFRSLHERMKRPMLRQTHNFWGVEPTAGSHDGIMATQSVDPSYHVSHSGEFTYTPTLKAYNSCMEITTAYWQYGDEVWAWDWCGGGGPGKSVTIDSDFLSTYTTTVNGHASYSVQLVETGGGNAWSSYLYNYETNTWELFFAKSGRDTSGLPYGWDLFEIYASTDPSTGIGYYCTAARNVVFESSDIELRHNGTWSPATPSNSPWRPYADPDPSAYLCPALNFIRAGMNDHWIVRQ